MYILIDIGGTKTRVAITRDGISFAPPNVFLTPQDFSSWLVQIHKCIEASIADKDLKGVIIGVPGTFTSSGEIISTPNLTMWSGVPLKEHIQKITSCHQVYLYNDTALVGLGEAVYGAGKDHPIVAYLTISTGVNGTRIVNEKIDTQAYGFEIGHSIVDIENGSDIESYIGGKSLEKKYGKPSKEIHDIIFWEKISRYAGIFGANTIMYWTPSVVVYGGPVMNDLHIDIIEKEAMLHLGMYKECPQFKRAALRDEGGLYGALKISNLLKTEQV